MSTKEGLNNLSRTGDLKAESPDIWDCEGLLRSAIDGIQDHPSSTLTFAIRSAI